MVGGVAKKAGAIAGTASRAGQRASGRRTSCRSAARRSAAAFPSPSAAGSTPALDDVVRLFAPGGLIHGFIKTQLATLVDTARAALARSPGVGLSSGALAQLGARDRISSAPVRGGACRGHLHLTPLDLDADSASVTLDVDGQAMQYAHGPARPRLRLARARPAPASSALTFAPVGGGPPVIVKEGAWSLFRLLHEAASRCDGQPDLFEVTMNGGGHSARFRLKAGSVENPFDLDLLGFACPDGL